MKIQRLMLAVLAVCGTSAALAQSSVTIYGRVNTTIERQKTGDETKTGMFNNSSRIGFKGVEDLGGGLKAGFVLESGFGSDDGSGPLAFKRQSEVNLSGNWGMVRMGLWTPESYNVTADMVSMHNHDTGSSSDAFYQYVMRDTNKLAYRTPEMGGFWAEGAYSFHEKSDIKNAAGVSTGVADNKNAWDLALNYGAGPLGLGAGYTARGENRQFAVRANYSVGPVVLGAYVQRAEVGDDFGFTNGKAKWNNYRLSAMYTLGASEFHANVGRADTRKVNGVKVENSAATQWTLGYNYNLSKRTKVYGYYTKVDNKAGAKYMTGANGADFSSFAAGIRHNF